MKYVQTRPAREPSTTVVCRRCGGHYVDDYEGRSAHVVVFDHAPEPRHYTTVVAGSTTNS